ncbi:MAG TPA: hypothetical protein PLH32_18330, partial [bacterium]|nr:hypothetical protein [bacterium]
MQNFFTSFFSGLLGRSKTPGREKIGALAEKGQDQAKSDRTTAPREFDVMPTSIRLASAEHGGIKVGFYWEVLDAWRMYGSDDRIRSTIDSIADDATQNNRRGLPFNIVVKTA